MKLKSFSQQEYSRVLDGDNARRRGLSQSQCEEILVAAGATQMQAKNGAYVYLHHGSKITARHRSTQSEYEIHLNRFGARNKEPKECIRHLEELGFSYGQAKTAVYRYRVRHGLIGK